MNFTDWHEFLLGNCLPQENNSIFFAGLRFRTSAAEIFLIQAVKLCFS